MSTTLKRKPLSEKAIRRPFAAAILVRAKKIASDYQIVIRFDQEEQEYYGRCVELPMSMGDGKTAGECVEHTMKGVVVSVAYLLEKGETPPPAATEEVRTEQVNIRLTALEKLRLETAAGQKGFRSLSEYMRSIAVGTTTEAVR